MTNLESADTRSFNGFWDLPRAHTFAHEHGKQMLEKRLLVSVNELPEISLSNINLRQETQPMGVRLGPSTAPVDGLKDRWDSAKNAHGNKEFHCLLFCSEKHGRFK